MRIGNPIITRTLAIKSFTIPVQVGPILNDLILGRESNTALHVGPTCNRPTLIEKRV